jgi:hypothetical protein
MKHAWLRVIIEKGGDYFIGNKGNTSKRHKEVETSVTESMRVFPSLMARGHSCHIVLDARDSSH